MKCFNTLAVALLFGATTLQAQTQAERNSDEAAFRQYISTLASDQFEGRKPFTHGETLTLDYLESQFKALGLKPANGNSYFQDVPMVDIASRFKDNRIVFSGASGDLQISPLDEMVGATKRVVKEQKIENVPLVFAGFGIDAPEYQWNDFEGIDVKGKIIVVMVNDPGFYNPDLFRGNDMTYYGRWTYKFEEGARQGAAGVLILHDTAGASYGWGVVRSGWSTSNLYLQTANDNSDACALEGWLSKEGAEKVFKLAGADLQALTESAKKPGFKPVPLNISLTTTIENTFEKKVSKNVAAILPGKDRPDEVVVYSAHWDHLGIGEPIKGDSIYNGAADNASGTAGLLTLAKMYKRSKANQRSVLFLAVTGEEQGLLGSEYYVKHPLIPLKNTVVDINMDVLQPFGKMKDILVVGRGQSNVDAYLERQAAKAGRVVTEPADKSNGWYYRSDHFNFAKVGVPTLYIGNGVESVEHGTAWGEQQSEEYNRLRYHKPQDEYHADWNVEGILDDLYLIFHTGKDLTNTKDWPAWNAGTMYEKIRKEQR